MHTSIIKVKAHTGLTGNEMADTPANEARQPAACDTMVSVGNTAFQDVFWPCARATAAEPQRTMSNLCDAVKRQVRHLSRGFASRGMYEGFWQDVMPELHPASFGFWNSSAVTPAAMTQVLKARYGQLWTMNQAVRYKMAYKPGCEVPSVARCPLCSGNDSIGHLLGECSHPVRKGLIIERHNEAGRMTLEQLRNGSQGACEFVADVGSQDKMARYDTAGNRVPAWLLGDRDLPEGSAQRAKLRPDILMITPAEQGMPIDGPRKVTLVEVSYCLDTRYKEKLAEKQQQHHGHKERVAPITLGSIGSVFKSNKRAVMTS